MLDDIDLEEVEDAVRQLGIVPYSLVFSPGPPRGEIDRK